MNPNSRQVVASGALNGSDELLLAPESEPVDGAADPACGHCGASFTPRKGKGGKPQMFCSAECRTAHNNAGRSQQFNDELAPTADLLAPRSSPTPQPDDERFDWAGDDNSVVLRDQRATAVYFNRHGGLVIRQERAWDEDEDHFVIIRHENTQAFLDKLCDICGIPSAGRP